MINSNSVPIHIPFRQVPQMSQGIKTNNNLPPQN
jgi:hypothetical protein